MAERDEELARAVDEALRRLVRRRLERRDGLDPGGPGAALELALAVPLDGEDGSAFRSRLIEGIDAALDVAVANAANLTPGRIWCHRCRGSGCEHGIPPSSRHVFTGYAATGQPLWVDLGQHCLDLGHPNVDRLYDSPPALVTMVSSRRELHRGLLEPFADPDYDLLGQLVAGFYPVPAPEVAGRALVALSVQVAGLHARRGLGRLALNLVGVTPSGDGLDRLWDTFEELPWRKSVGWARAALATVDLRRDTNAVTARVDGILHGLARRLEREHRSRGRRTRHAERRHVSGERPTRKALDDARVVPGERLLLDARKKTIVVLGDRGRTHVFTLDGQHVTSVRYSREAIERKQRAELWKQASDDVVAAFRAKLPA